MREIYGRAVGGSPDKVTFKIHLFYYCLNCIVKGESGLLCFAMNFIWAGWHSSLFVVNETVLVWLVPYMRVCTYLSLRLHCDMSLCTYCSDKRPDKMLWG